jgi:hypothetical protein
LGEDDDNKFEISYDRLEIKFGRDDEICGATSAKKSSIAWLARADDFL